MITSSARNKVPNGFVIYRGPSLIDGGPVVVVVLTSRSRNTKTGAMTQTYILRADTDPITANRMGLDRSICGQCKFRGTPNPAATSGTAMKRGCYVSLIQGPTSVYRSLIADKYPTVIGHDGIAAIGDGRRVRVGTYGDPAAVPSYVWDSLLTRAAGYTAYTHQFGFMETATPDRFMASVSSESDARTMWGQGWRTFRVIADRSDVIRGREILCPASKEMGKRSSCSSCGLCGGSEINAKSIAIVAHGSSANNAIGVM